ncbi:MAG: hypothetical protein TREMPRED_003813 [Tremellales sp. Tagirdzhanova-0007]|nr:MAG: hypothetical protein TREMPRED_003813 [Tremellales sp. Tagirdzhanova-0007]
MSTITSPASITDENDRARALLDLAISLIDSALDVLGNHVHTDTHLQHQSLLMLGGTIGKHFRHVIETFHAFLLPLHHSLGLGHRLLEMNYDATLPTSRRPLARSVQACRQAMLTIRDDLVRWGERHRALESVTSSPGVPGDVDREGLAGEMRRMVDMVALTPTKQEMQSSVGRELWFCSLHAIHHFSMLRTIAVHELGLELPVEFGTAPSTLLYRGKGWKPPVEKKEVRVLTSKL